MSDFFSDPVALFADLSLILLSLSALCALVRLVMGPSLPDRVAALDLTAMIVIGMTATYSISSKQDVFLDVAIALALVIFLGTVAFSRYLEKGLQS